MAESGVGGLAANGMIVAVSGWDGFRGDSLGH